jgi:hypothetical protein
MSKQRTVVGAPTSPSPRSTHSKDRRRSTARATAKAVSPDPDTIAGARAQLVRAGEHGSFSDGRDAWDDSGPSAEYTFLYRA